jgi:hypothetical protein
MGDELGAADLNEIGGLGDDVLKQLDPLTHAAFVINDLRCRLAKLLCGAEGPSVGLCFIAGVIREPCCPLWLGKQWGADLPAGLLQFLLVARVMAIFS